MFYLILQDRSLNKLSASDSLTFFSALGFLIHSSSSLGRFINIGKQGQAAITRLIELEQHLRKEAETANTQPETCEELICLNNVFFSYGSKNLFTKLNLSFDRNKWYRISAPSGGGKSTLLKIILEQLTPHQGFLTFSKKKDLKKIYIPQTPPLIHGTIAENIAYPTTEINQTLVIHALKKTHLLDYVHSLPKKEETLLGPKGQQLSGGQSQRIALARAFYHSDVDFIIIDEGTSQLDPELELDILKQLKNETQKNNTTVIITSHRDSIEPFVEKTIEL
jgi:ABC-type multidrug transport system fused ATPase/permease subunit